jgi:hypothetical protein
MARPQALEAQPVPSVVDERRANGLLGQAGGS